MATRRRKGLTKAVRTLISLLSTNQRLTVAEYADVTFLRDILEAAIKSYERKERK